MNYLKTKFIRNTLDENIDNNPKSFGFIDIGGASAQIAFEPTKQMSVIHQDDLHHLKIRYQDGTDLKFGVFVATFLGFGVDQARAKFIEKLASGKRSEIGDTTGLAVSVEKDMYDPCLPLGLVQKSTIGTGNYRSCFDKITPLLNKHIQCQEQPCLFDGLHAPIEDFRNHRFIGVSNVWYTTFEVYDLGGDYSYFKLEQASRQFCETGWDEIESNYRKGVYKNVNSLESLELHCFKSLYLLNLLHKGLNIPMDYEGGPLLESADVIDGFSTSWTLGVLLLYASATIPAKADLSGFNHWVFLGVILTIVAVLSRTGIFRSHGTVFDLSRYHQSQDGQYVEISMSPINIHA